MDAADRKVGRTRTSPRMLRWRSASIKRQGRASKIEGAKLDDKIRRWCVRCAKL